MSICLYDRAVVDKIKAMIPPTDIHVYGPEDTHKLIELQADANNDKPIKLPLVSISREPNIEISDPARAVLSTDGAILDKSIQNTVELNAIPMIISYRINIYARYLEEADNYLRSILYNLINHPQINVVIPYMDRNFVHQSAIEISPTVTDNSDIPERLISGQFTRFTISVSVKDAYLWNVKEYANVTFSGASVEVEDY